ncbi:MAG TPA: cation diffusion facilitator family transporter [Lacipirellula sp.]
MHRHHHPSSAGENLRFAFLLNALFTVLEIAGGLWTGSVAILSDAVHDCGDCLSLGFAWYLQRLSDRGPDETFNYGYRRLSSLGALVTSVVLIVGLSFVVWEAIERLQDPREVRAGGVIGIAVVGILLNGAAALRLHGGTSLNERVATWHLLEDVLGWIAVLIGGVVMSIWDAPWVDPLLSLLIAAVILRNVVKNLKRVGLVFLQASPSGFDVARFDHDVRQFPGVKATHHTHTWTLDGERHVLSTHVVVDAGSTREMLVDVKRRIYSLLHDQHFEHVTIEIELEGEQCSLDERFAASHAEQ